MYTMCGLRNARVPTQVLQIIILFFMCKALQSLNLGYFRPEKSHNVSETRSVQRNGVLASCMTNAYINKIYNT